MMPVISMGIPVPAKRGRPTKREIARLIIAAREVENMRIHAHRDECMPHHLLAGIVTAKLVPFLPRWLRRNRDLVHRYIEMPAARQFSRREGE